MDYEFLRQHNQFELAMQYMNQQITDYNYMLDYSRLDKKIEKEKMTLGGRLIIPDKRVAVAKFKAK